MLGSNIDLFTKHHTKTTKSVSQLLISVQFAYFHILCDTIMLYTLHILRLTSFQSSVTDLSSSLTIILTVISTHSIVHTDPDDVFTVRLQFINIVYVSVSDPLLIVSFVG